MVQTLERRSEIKSTHRKMSAAARRTSLFSQHGRRNYFLLSFACVRNIGEKTGAMTERDSPWRDKRMLGLLRVLT